MSNPSYTISHSAYLKIILHAAKYPHAQVSGLLLGYFGPGGSNVVVEDAVPLLHHWNALAPITEVGITLVSKAGVPPLFTEPFSAPHLPYAGRSAELTPSVCPRSFPGSTRQRHMHKLFLHKLPRPPPLPLACL